MKKRNRFLTIVFSFLPGAGHMFMGFMKKGISFMSAFFLIIFFTAWLDVGLLGLAIPVLWFYAFFDCINTLYATDEQFLECKDEYLFSFEQLFQKNQWVKEKYGILIGGVLIFFGIYLIIPNVVNNLANFGIPAYITKILNDFIRLAPKILVSCIIIIIGIKLIIGKKKELKEND